MEEKLQKLLEKYAILYWQSCQRGEDCQPASTFIFIMGELFGTKMSYQDLYEMGEKLYKAK